jgi:hypothetical protein
MKTYDVQFDATKITVVAESVEDVVSILRGKDKRFFIDETGKVRYTWTDMYHDIVHVKEVKLERGIIHWESH